MLWVKWKVIDKNDIKKNVLDFCSKFKNNHS